MPPNRTQSRLQERILQRGKTFTPWTPAEDEILGQGLQKHGRQCKLVVVDLPGRTVKQCCTRLLALNPLYQKGHWLPDEDKRLKEADADARRGNWSSVSIAVRTRSNDQCRRRWVLLQSLEPNAKVRWRK